MFACLQADRVACQNIIPLPCFAVSEAFTGKKNVSITAMSTSAKAVQMLPLRLGLMPVNLGEKGSLFELYSILRIAGGIRELFVGNTYCAAFQQQ